MKAVSAYSFGVPWFNYAIICFVNGLIICINKVKAYTIIT